MKRPGFRPPAIEASKFAEIHRDSVSGEIVDVGGVYARAVGSVFQTDEVALKLRWPISWALRSPAPTTTIPPKTLRASAAAASSTRRARRSIV